MDEPETQNRGDICHRCLEPVPAKASRCPRCGERVHKPANLRKTLAFFGLLMFLAVAAVAFRMLQTSGARPVPATTETAHQPGDPDTPPPPPPKPALGQ